MIRGVVYSKRLTFFGAAAVGAACVAALMRHHLVSEKVERRVRAADIEDSLSRQIAAISDCDDAHLEELRGRVGRFRGQLGPDDAWARLVRRFGQRWTSEAGQKEERDGYSFQVGTLMLISPSVSDWPGILDSVKAAEQIPGIGIAGLEMRSSGNRELRSMGMVKIVVAIHSRKP